MAPADLCSKRTLLAILLLRLQYLDEKLPHQSPSTTLGPVRDSQEFYFYLGSGRFVKQEQGER